MTKKELKQKPESLMFRVFYGIKIRVKDLNSSSRHYLALSVINVLDFAFLLSGAYH